MSNNEKFIWDYCLAQGLSQAGTAGLMGNLYAESGFNPKNLQNTFEKKLGMTDAEYTTAVDNGTYTNFIYDKAGYGIAQWTYWSLKQDLLNYARMTRKSIGNLEMQIEFLLKQLQCYRDIYPILLNTKVPKEASDAVLLNFERPGSVGPNATPQQREDTCNLRASYAQEIYNKYAKEVTEQMNSPLVTYTHISPNRTSPRTHAIDTITIHCIVGQWDVKQACDYFANSNVQASPNYVVDKNGKVGLCVPESDRSWCTGGKLNVMGNTGKMNDHRAITIETASDLKPPYWATDAAIDGLINLCTDICQRHGKTKLLWFNDPIKTLSYTPKNDEMLMTIHAWFANKSCPGEYIESKLPYIVSEVNKRLNGEEDDDMTQEKFDEMMDNYLSRLANENPAGWEQAGLIWAQENGLLQGDGTGNLQPHSFMTRGQLATVLYRYANRTNK